MQQQIFSISQVNEYLRTRMDADPMLAQIAVRGEISNYKMYPSGHHYFTLKDEGAALKCVMFKGNAQRLRFRPENGMQVIAMGRITVYPRDGAFQLYCASMVVDGVGDLYAAFEQLKTKLAAQGLFDPGHKQPLPKYPGVIGIVTSSAGAGPGGGSARGDSGCHTVCQPIPAGRPADCRQGRRLYGGSLGIQR